MSQPPRPGPNPEVYAAVAARRIQFDNLVWQVPVLGFTAQAFLFTIALGADTKPAARYIACALSLIVTFLTVQILTRHRQAEITDAHWLEEYELRNDVRPRAHGRYWQHRREETSPDAGVFTPLARLPGYKTWAILLSLFAAAAVAVVVISIGWPQLLQR
jgi:hypothetical protein